MTKNNNKCLVDALKDAGCEPETVILFLQMHEDENLKGQLSLLAEHRKILLDKIHSEQARLDCLDYFIHQIKTNNK